MYGEHCCCVSLENKEAIIRLHKVFSTNNCDPVAMTPHICSVHVLVEALQALRTGFSVVFKGGQKDRRLSSLMRWKAQERGSLVWRHGWAGSKGGPETVSCKELKPAPKWPEESSADRTLTSIHHKIRTLTMPSYKLQAHCSFLLFALVSLQSASMQAALTSSPCCRREQGS